MKPICLELCAFGSYAEPTLLSFDALTHGLYLVTGDTGAGKTTIFDGIVFALYGQASGRDRNPAMMHCDFVEKSVDTVVKLTFSQASRRYTATRIIHFPKKRKGDGGFGDAEIQALLTGEDLTPVEGASRVTAACEALLGLNAEQFRKIVMLAQGEFRDFLKADSEKKNEILGKLFDSSAYLWYQRLFERAWHRLEAERDAERDALRNLLETRLSLPQDSDPARFLPDEPELLENLDALLEQARSESAALEAALKAAEAQRDGLLVQKTEGLNRNKLLDQLEDGEARLAALEAQADSFAQRSAVLERAETALYRAMPPLREAERCARDRDAVRESEAQMQSLLDQRRCDYHSAVKSREQDEALREQKDAIAALLTELERQLALFSDLQQAQQSLARARTGQANCVARQDRLSQALKAAADRRSELQRQLEDLSDLDLRLDQARREQENAARIQTKYNEIQTGCGALKNRAARLAENDTAFRNFTRDVLAAQARYNELYRRFLAGQAGLLAGELRRAVEEQGDALCPVCGTRLDGSHLQHLPPKREETPSKETVEAARKQAEDLEQTRQQKKEQLDLAHSQFLSKRELMLRETAQLCSGCEDWETLTAPGFLEGLIDAAAARSAAAAEALAAAEAAWQERSKLQQALAEVEQSIEALRAEQDSLRQERTEQEKALSAAEQCSAMLQSQLCYPNEAAAKAEADRLRAAHSRLREQLLAHETAEKQAKAALDTLEGQLQSTRKTLEERIAAADRAEAALRRSLAETGFSDAGAVAEALLPCRGMEGEAWLQRERAALSDYDHRRKTLTQTVAELRQQAAGQERSDPEALDQAFAAADNRCQTLRQQERGLHQWFENCTEVRDLAGQRLAALEATQGAWNRLEKLGSLAAGSKGDGGRLSFERYVMGAVFREILEMANRRLDLISGGRYQLEHKTAANRANAQAGLDIEILDLSTGKRRPSASLSGGEAFYTSLALALGLSDVVQHHAGGMKLEALFIDEGFGTLDEDMLDNALAVLNQLTQGNRLVGIISHVDKLSASIPQKIVVKSGPKGSSLRVVV